MEFKSFMEALKGKQHKIDKNKNGEVDAHDFKLLRKEETEELEEASVKSEKHSWGKMMTVHHGASHSYPLHPEHQEAIRNLKHGEKTSFKDETGAKVNVHRDVQDVHFTSNKTSTKTTVPHSHFSEETELDEIHRMKTKLNSLDDISNKSIARQKLSHLRNSGKTSGALIANKMRTLNMGEEVKHVDEGNGYDDNRHGFRKPPREDDEYHVPDPVRKPQAPVAPVPDKKYIRGTPENKAAKAASKPRTGHPTNEEVEQIEEKSDQAKQNKAMKNMMDASRGARYKLNNPVPDASPEQKTAQAHNKAIGRALRSEDKMTTTKDKSGKLVSFKYEGDWKKSTEKKQGSGKAANLAGQGMQTMAKSQDLARARKVNAEEVEHLSEAKDEQEYGYEGDMALNQLATLTRCAEMIKEMLKPDTDMPEWVQSKITLATDYIQTAADYMHSEMNEGKSVDIDKVNVAGDAAHEEKFETFKKTKRVKESFDDEGNLISNKISYKDFITEIKLADLPSRRIQGRSYGANYSDPEGADDYDDKKPIKPAADKRGRGRPAGAKSGARKITGTSKLINK